MPINTGVRTIDALCLFFANNPEFELTSYALASVISGKVPGAELIQGFARGEEVVPYNWIRFQSRDHDVCYEALLHRSLVSRSLKCICERPVKLQLLAREQGDASKMENAITDWILPRCPACCGKQKAHSLDDQCQSPWKAELLMLRKYRPECRPRGERQWARQPVQLESEED
jgi:hypothetical protein